MERIKSEEVHVVWGRLKDGDPFNCPKCGAEIKADAKGGWFDYVCNEQSSFDAISIQECPCGTRLWVQMGYSGL